MPHTILFTGHMIDKPGRSFPRFPPSKEYQAALAIQNALKKTLTNARDKVAFGIAAAACGGDILFHEACLKLQIPSELFLATPAAEFEKTSVSFAGPNWTTRYKALLKELPIHILHPNATAGAPDSIWEEANQWMLDQALANGGNAMTLIALWDQKKGDGLGGAEHMVRVAKAHNAAIDIIDVHSL